jgi:hypothetical protein
MVATRLIAVIVVIPAFIKAVLVVAMLDSSFAAKVAFSMELEHNMVVIHMD